MRLSYFRHPEAKTANGRTPSRNLFSLDVLRERILFGTLIVFLILGLVAFINVLPGKIEQKQWGYVLGFTLGLGWTAAVTFASRIKYQVRAVSLLLVIASLGFFSLVTDGLSGNGRLYLLAVPVVAGLIFKARSSILALILSMAGFILVGFLVQRGTLTLSNLPASVESSDARIWLLAGVSLFLVSTSLALAVASLLRGLEVSFEEERYLAGELDTERARQDHRVLQRTQEMEQRLLQIRAAMDIIQTISSEHNLEHLLSLVAEQIKEKFNYYFAGIFLVDDRNEFAVLQAGSGEAGNEMLRSGYQLAVDETSSAGWSALHQQAKVAVDVGFEAVRFNNPLLPLTRSELALPLMVAAEKSDLSKGSQKYAEKHASKDHGRGPVLGVLVVQSVEAKAFNQDEIAVLQGVAASLSAALVNAGLFEQLKHSLEETQALNRQYLLESWKDVTRQADQHQFSSVTEKTTPLTLDPEFKGIAHRYPLLLRDQEIGQLTLDIDREGLSEEENAFIEAVTTQAAVALENVRLLEKNQRQAGYERLLSEISRKARSSTDLDTILRVTIQELGRVLGATDGVIRLEIPTGEEEVLL